MKTKTKTLAVVQIAIVLCSVFLVALPAIAAASEIYEPGPLDVFGNANEDDTIDMRDTTYIKLVIFGKKPETKLADANYDGKISMLDVGQTKLIILGKEKKLTYIDILGEAETVNKPIKRLANIGWMGIEFTRALGAMEILLPISGSDRKNERNFYPEISTWPVVGRWPEVCDFEKILSLQPDAFHTAIECNENVPRGSEYKSEFKEKLPGIPLISLNCRELDAFPKTIRTYGYIIERKNEGKEYSDWFEGWMNTFKARTEGLSEDEKPRVYFEIYGRPYTAACPTNRFEQVFVIAGGRNIVDEMIGPDHPLYGLKVEVDPEWVIEQNPEVIIAHSGYGYDTDDPSDKIAARQAILDRPELANVNAVRNRRVYIVTYDITSGGPRNIIGIAYIVKALHPDLFADIDPQAIHQEYIDKWCHIDFNVEEHGVFIYPPPEEW